MKTFLPLILVLSHSPFAFGEAIEDNSFLIEEAYNQEKGVVQFVQGLQYMEQSKALGYTFSNEIPMGSQSHQFS